VDSSRYEKHVFVHDLLQKISSTDIPIYCIKQGQVLRYKTEKRCKGMRISVPPFGLLMSTDTDLLRNSERFIIYLVCYAISLELPTTLTHELR